MFSKKDILKDFAKRLWHTCFPANFLTFSRTPIFIKHLWWLKNILFDVNYFYEKLHGSCLIGSFMLLWKLQTKIVNLCLKFVNSILFFVIYRSFKKVLFDCFKDNFKQTFLLKTAVIKNLINVNSKEPGRSYLCKFSFFIRLEIWRIKREHLPEMG